MSTAGLSGIRQTLRQPNYRRYISGNSVSLVGTWMQKIAAGWLTWELTHSPAWLGILALATLFPSVILGPIGGALADRFDRIRIMITAQTLAMVFALMLFALTATGSVTVEAVVFLNLCTGAVIALGQASRLALPPSIVPTQNLTTAIAINSMIFNTARFVGPLAAGVVIDLWGVHVAFAVNAATYLALIAALASLKLNPDQRRAQPRQPRSILGDISEGVVFVYNHPAARPVLTMLIVSAFCLRPISELLPGVADDVFGRGVDGFTALTAGFGVGAIGGGLWMAQRGGREDLPKLALLGSLITLAGVLGMVSTQSFIAALACTVVSGFGLVMTGVGTQSTLQFLVDGDLRGRVLSLYGVIFVGGPALGALALGGLAETIGLRWPIGGAALLALAVWLLIWPKRRSITAAMVPTP